VAVIPETKKTQRGKYRSLLMENRSLKHCGTRNDFAHCSSVSVGQVIAGCKCRMRLLLSSVLYAYLLYRQPDHTRTIEGVLFNALVKVGAVSQDNADNPTKVSSFVVCLKLSGL